MRRRETLTVHGSRFRVRAATADSSIASVALLPSRRLPEPGVVDACLEMLRADGYRGVMTSALAPGEARPFRAAGFELHHELHLLRRPLDTLPVSRQEHMRVRRARRRDWPEVLRIDADAFDEFWRFDETAIRDALAATPNSRFRVFYSTPLAGYHISGVAGSSGYLQRLAVDPSRHRQGVGTALLVDALEWMRSRGAATVYVNTQVSNAVALATYLHHGFELQPDRLSVLTRALTDAPVDWPTTSEPGPGARPDDTATDRSVAIPSPTGAETT